MLNGNKVPLAVDLAVVLALAVSIGVYKADFKALADDVKEIKLKVPPERMAVLESKVDETKENIKEIKDEQKEQRKILEEIYRKVR